VIPSAVLLVFGVVMGTVFIWDLGGFASRMRQRLEERSFDGAFYRRMPAWALRAFGIWAMVFGIGQFVYIVTTTR
jgi:hypothetical protein